MMTSVYLSLGSNIDPKKNLSSAIACLRKTFGTLRLSPVYESHAVGFNGDNFLNLALGFTTDWSMPQLSQYLRDIEEKHGRLRLPEKFSSRTLDIDILLFGHVVGIIEGMELPRPDIAEHAFVLLPLSDIYPDYLHPKSNKTLLKMAQEIHKNDTTIWPIDARWLSN